MSKLVFLINAQFFTSGSHHPSLKVTEQIKFEECGDPDLQNIFTRLSKTVDKANLRGAS